MSSLTTVQINYANLYPATAALSKTTLSIPIPFNVSDFAIPFASSNASVYLAEEMASNGSSTAPGRLLVSNEGVSFNYNNDGTSGTINVSVPLDTLNPNTAAIALQITLTLQMQATSTSAGFSTSSGLVVPNPADQQQYKVLAQVTTSGILTVSPVQLLWMNYPINGTAQPTMQSVTPIVPPPAGGMPPAGTASTVTVTVPITVSAPYPLPSPAVDNLGVTFTLTLLFGGLRFV